MNNFKINKVGPMHVSFEGIMLAEIPCYDIIPPEGYYATTNYTNSLSHTEDPGAGTTRRVSPGNYWTVDLAGKVKIGRGAWIGIGATIINCVEICEDAYIGAGAVVIDDINENGTYVGVPAKKIR